MNRIIITLLAIIVVIAAMFTAVMVFTPKHVEEKSNIETKIAEEEISIEDVYFQAYETVLLDEVSNVVQPEKMVTMKIPVPQGYQGENCKVYYVKNNGNLW